MTWHLHYEGLICHKIFKLSKFSIFFNFIIWFRLISLQNNIFQNKHKITSQNIYYNPTSLVQKPGLTKPWEPVRFDQLPVKPVWADYGFGRYPTSPNSKFKFEFKKLKNSQIIPKNTLRCDESNGVKFFQIFIHLVYFASNWS